MPATEIITYIMAAAAGAGILFGLARARVDWVTGSATRDKAEHDEVKELLALKDQMIAALEKANADFAGRIDRMLKREDAWASEREDYKRRLHNLEEEYRTLVKAVAAAGICSHSPSCPNHTPPGKEITA